jgi:hypothetical protein
MDMDTKYNGWANKDTWCVNLWFGDDMHDSAKGNGRAIDADWCKEMVEEYLENSVGNVFTGFIGDIVMSFISSVDWREIANSVNEAAELSDADTDADTDDDDDGDGPMDIVEYLMGNK